MSSPLIDQVRSAMVAARSNRDKDRTILFSTLLADIGNREIELAHALSEPEVLEVLQRGAKCRRESVDQRRADGRRVNGIAREVLAG